MSDRKQNDPSDRHWPVFDKFSGCFAHASTKADAALIVQAVNSHAALVSALAAIVEFCDDPNGSFVPGSLAPESLAMGLSRLLVPARAALAKEGK